MNNTYTDLAQKLSQLEERVNRFAQQLDQAESGSPAKNQGRFALEEIRRQIASIRKSFLTVAQTGGKGVPPAWDMVSIVPADEADPAQMERPEGIPFLEELDAPYEKAVTLLHELRAQIRERSEIEAAQRQVLAEEVEEMGELLEHYYEVARGAHNAHYYKTYS